MHCCHCRWCQREAIAERARAADRALPQDIHINTASKLPWVQLPAGARAETGFYDARQAWPAESLARWRQAVSAQRRD